MSYIFDGDDGIDVQLTLDNHLSKEKSKSLDNINSIDDNLNTYPSNDNSNRGDVESIRIAIDIPTNDYDFVYTRFDKCLGETPELLDEFFKDAIVSEINQMRNDGVDGNFIETITLPHETMKKLNGMLYYHETKGEQFSPSHWMILLFKWWMSYMKSGEIPMRNVKGNYPR